MMKWFLILAVLTATATAVVADDKVAYNRDVRPILAENCFACHGPDSAARKADLRLDRRDDAVKSEAFVPGKPDESELISRIVSTDEKEMMPPPPAHKKLTPAQKETLKRWIAQGAEYQPHWSFIAPKRPALPAVKDPSWGRNPIDRFIRADLDRLGLAPAPEADRRTLARRVALDLTGLPPEPAAVEAFVNDAVADAYERYVDTLLASPHWGEHRARYWLDAARYGDTNGIHIDNYREIWAYRDWVIDAFNHNLPFDRFTIEQLAGDLLPNRSLDQQVASGFNRCNITTSEGGAINEEYLVLYNRDRTETTAQVWLGLTAGCAVCHDHKFDPLSQREFYSLAAFFNNTTQAAMDGNVKDTPPVVVVPRREDRMRWDELVAAIGELTARVEARKKEARPAFDQYLAAARATTLTAAIPHDGLRFHALLAEGVGNQVTVTEDGQARLISSAKPLVWKPGHIADQAWQSTEGVRLESESAGDFEKDQPFAASAWIKPTRNRLNGAVLARMDDAHGFRGWDLWLDNGRLASHVIHEWEGDALKVIGKDVVKVNQWHHVAMSYDGSGKASGVKLYLDGVAQGIEVAADRLKGTIRTEVPLTLAQRNSESRLDGLLVQDVRLYGRALSAADVRHVMHGTRAAALVAKAKRSPGETNELFDWWLATLDKPSQEFSGRLVTLEEERAAIRGRGTLTHVMQEKPTPAEAYVLFRGDYDKRRDKVAPATPAALSPWPSNLPKNRLGFAEWLLRPENPLTARVTVNRFWQEVFGTGLVRTSGDFGVTGEQPSNPELLDWLAVEFRESGWDVKEFFKLMVTSAAYRQSAVATRDKLDKDAANRYLSRGPRFRMDGEMVRDYALAASGLLVAKVGGPSVKPYQPEGVWEAVAMRESNTRNYKPDSGENLYRRSMYTFWKRSAPPAAMDVFNAPSRETCTVRRERTNTPLQALVTLNDPQFVEAARHLAERALKEGNAQLDYLALRLLSRPLRPEEKPVVAATLDDLLDYYRGHADDAKKLVAIGESKADPALDIATLAAWTMTANEMLNLDEVLNK